MSVKILQLEGLTDLRLSHLLEKLMTTIPGVSAANINFLTQNLTLTLEDGTDVQVITEQAAAEIEKHAPDVTIRFQEISSARAKPRLNVPVRPILRPSEEEEEEDILDEDDLEDEDDEEDDQSVEPSPEKGAAQLGKGASWQLPSRFSVSAILYCASVVLLFLYRTASGLRFSWAFLVASFFCCALSFFFPLRRAWYQKMHATAVIAPLGLLVLFLTGAQLSAVVALLILRTGCYLSSFFFWRVDAALRNTADLCPETVRLLVESTPISTAASAVAPTNKLFVLAGEQIGLDGVICEGNSRIRAVLPGAKEELFEVGKGDAVRCGDLNLDSPLTVTVTVEQSASLARRIKDAMLSAVSIKDNGAAVLVQAQKYSRAMGLFFLAVILLSTAISALSSGQLDVWLRQSSVALLILCPCSFGLAARALYASGLIRAFKNGIAVRGAAGLDALSKVQTMVAVGFSRVFASGSYRILAIEPVEGIDAGELLETAAYAESASAHPIAAAIRAAYEEGIGDKLTLPDDVQTAETVPGYGARAMIGKRITLVGSARFMQDAGVEIPADETGDTMVYIAVCGEHMGSIRLENPLRSGARAIGPALCSVGVTSSHIISGCDEPVLSTAKKELLVDEIHHAPSQNIKQNILSGLVERLPEKETLALVGPAEKISAFPGSCCRILTGEVIGEAAFSLADVSVGAGGPEKLAAAVRCGKRISSMMLFDTILSLAIKGTLLVLILTGSVSAVESAFALSVLSLLLGLLSFGSAF